MASRRVRGGLDAHDMEVLEELDRRQVATGDGSRSLSEWTTARLDMRPDTAKALVQTMRRTAQRPRLRELLAAGEVSFDRVEALSRISAEVGLLLHLDVAGVLTEAAKRVRITAQDESGRLTISSWSCSLLWMSPGGSCGVGWTDIRERSSTRRSPRPPTSYPPCLMVPGVIRLGGKRWRSPNCAFLRMRLRLRSPCSSTPERPPGPMPRREWSWKRDQGWASRGLGSGVV